MGLFLGKTGSLIGTVYGYASIHLHQVPNFDNQVLILKCVVKGSEHGIDLTVQCSCLLERVYTLSSVFLALTRDAFHFGSYQFSNRAD